MNSKRTISSCTKVQQKQKKQKCFSKKTLIAFLTLPHAVVSSMGTDESIKCQ